MTGPWRDVTLCKVVSRLDLWKYYTLYGGMWNLFCRTGHNSCVQNLSGSIQRRNPACNAEDNLRAGLIVIEAWFGATEGVLDKGVSGQLDYILWPDCWTMKIQD